LKEHKKPKLGAVRGSVKVGKEICKVVVVGVNKIGEEESA